ncbi:MAG: tRNA glutamyl-Q(34) synthetase GluQRS [Planctomycetota bacterium]
MAHPDENPAVVPTSKALYRGRLAPSPTGALHLGNARTFLIAWLRARQHGGTLVMRMEDIDSPRTKHGAEAAAYEALRWLGLDWDEGPALGGDFAPYVQSGRLARYEAALRRLENAGLCYPCVCSRKEIAAAASAPHGSDGPVYPGTCRDRFTSYQQAKEATGREPALRLRSDRLVESGGAVGFIDRFAGSQSMQSGDLGDFVVAKAGRAPAYQLACVVDDAAMRITEVVRADDLIPSTPRQLLLYRALGLTPPAFLHVPLVVGPEGRRLAKRHGDTRVLTLRDAGVSASRVVGLLAAWLGIPTSMGEATPQSLCEGFELARLSPGPWVFDAHADARTLGVDPRRFG